MYYVLFNKAIRFDLDLLEFRYFIKAEKSHLGRKFWGEKTQVERGQFFSVVKCDSDSNDGNLDRPLGSLITQDQYGSLDFVSPR